MTSDKHIKIASIAFGIAVMTVMALAFGVPGLLLGAIIGVFGSLSMSEWLKKRKPENRRRIRRMLRNEGMS